VTPGDLLKCRYFDVDGRELDETTFFQRLGKDGVHIIMRCVPAEGAYTGRQYGGPPYEGPVAVGCFLRPTAEAMA
jgi:hypothetical protein